MVSESEKCPVCGSPKSGWLDDNCPTCLLRLGSTVDEARGAAVLAVSEGGSSPPHSSETPGRTTGEEDSAARRLGDYELVEEIARGGMGVVYRARQVSLNRFVAVKVLLGGQFANDTFLKRFRREAEAAASLNHPNIVSIYEIGGHEGQPYFSMELVEGRSLAELAGDNPLPARRAARLVKTIGEAVHYAHEHGLLHRDLKPSNVLVDELDGPHITDFGLAKFLLPPAGGLSKAGRAESGTANDLTLTGQVLGTPNYMSPEQADPRRGGTTAASDVYSLGAILYHLLVGRPPFMAETVTQTLRLVSEGEPVPPRLWNPNVPRDLETVCLKCLEKEPHRRYSSAQELVGELGRFLEDEPIHARPIGAAAKAVRWCRRKPALALSLGTAITLLLIVAIGSPIALVRIERERQRAESARNQEAVLRARAESAERETERQLYSALREQARANVRSGELGQRVHALEAVRRAAAISNSVELRREAFAALALPDFRSERELPYDEGYTLRELDPSFERIALAREAGTVEVRALSDGRLLAALPPSTNWPAHDAQWSRDGRFLAIKRDRVPDGLSADWEVWEVASARRVLILSNVLLAAAAFHPVLPQILSGAAPGNAVVRNLENGREIARFAIGGGAPFLMRYAPAGERFAAVHMADERWTLSVYNATSGARLASRALANYPRNFQWHPAGGWLAVADDAGAVHSLDAQTGAMRLIGAHRAQAATVTFSPDGGWLLSGGWDNELICWNARTLRRAFSLGLDSFAARFRSDGRACAVVRASGIQWLSFERPTEHREFSEDLGSRLRHAAFSGDGRWLAVSGNKRAALWDLSSDGPGTIADEAFEAFFYFQRDELFASRSREGDDACFRWQIVPATNAALPPGLVPLPIHRPEGFTFLSASSNAVVMTGSKGSQLLAPTELESGSAKWARTDAGVNGVSRNGRWLGIYRPFSASLFVHRLPGLERAARLTHPANISDFEFSPLGDEVAIGSSRGLEFWSTHTWRRTRAFNSSARRIHYAPDALGVWITTDLRTAGLFDAHTLEPLFLLPAGMNPLALSPDGRRLAVSVDGRRLQVWDLNAVRKRFGDLGLNWGPQPIAVRSNR